jgi:hypothetical protein
MEKKPAHPPKWWAKAIKDLERAVAASTRSFQIPGTVLGYSEDNEGEKRGIIVRLDNGECGYFSKERLSQIPMVGAIIKKGLPEPEVIVKEPLFDAFVFEVVRERVKLIPPIWLRKVIAKMASNQPITMGEDLKPFPEWVFLPQKLKKDKALIDLLYRATAYEGLKGLERFNDKR